MAEISVCSDDAAFDWRRDATTAPDRQRRWHAEKGSQEFRVGLRREAC